MIKKGKRSLTGDSLDRVIVAIGLAYVLLPIVTFMLGWLKVFYSIPICVLLVLLGIRVWREMANEGVECQLFTRDTKAFWLFTVGATIIWVYLSGIGSFVFQNDDYWVRNPIFRDLSTLKWPVVYDLSKESARVQELCGDTTVAFSYYFCWWLPVSAVSKLFHLNDAARGVVLSVWAVLGVLTVFYLICRKLRKCSWIIPVVFVFFSGLDYIPAKLLNAELDATAHIEWWAGFFQYSSNTTLLFWVFNQAIPIWVLMALLLQLNDNRNIAALSSLVFAYSPWATFGMVPIAIAASVKKGKTLKLFNPLNICIPILMLVVFGSFYIGGGGSEGKIGLVFTVYDASNRRILLSYLVFLLFEVLVYFAVLGKEAYKYELYKTVLVELLLFPLIVVRDFNFVMRGTIPALFLLTYYVIRYLIEKKNEEDREIKVRYIALVVVLFLGSINPLHEINRTVRNTMQSDYFLQESVVSFANMQIEDDHLIATAREQFFVYDYEDSFFFKYLGR